MRRLCIHVNKDEPKNLSLKKFVVWKVNFFDVIWDDSDVDEQLERNPLPYIMRVDIGLFGIISHH